MQAPKTTAPHKSIAAKESRGYAFGVHKALDKAGAVLGPLVAYGLLKWLGESASTYGTLFTVAFVPAVLSVLVLTRITDKPDVARERESVRQNWQQLSPGFKRFLWYAAINLWLVLASSRWEMVAVFAICGVFFAIDESQSKAFIADLEPERRATAVGAYNFVTGVLYLPASLVAGALWTVAPSLAFALAALLAAHGFVGAGTADFCCAVHACSVVVPAATAIQW